LDVSVGLSEQQLAVEVELLGGPFIDSSGARYDPGRYRLSSELELAPIDPTSCAFALADITIGRGFHWQRKERQIFRGVLRLLRRDRGLTVINDVPIEDYVTSVISSEMSATCPFELLKAHAVISRSWLWFSKANRSCSPQVTNGQHDPHEIIRWYSREKHADFDVCADDHCQRYQGLTKVSSPYVSEAVSATAGLLLRYEGAICDARFSKCCGGITERYSTAWEDKEVPYLCSVVDGPMDYVADSAEMWIRSRPAAYCDTQDAELLARVLPTFDQETRDFFRWKIEYSSEELAKLVSSKLGLDLGPIHDLVPLARGPSGRIYRLKIVGERDYVIIGKELEIRRCLSPTHLYSSAFVVDRKSDWFILRGAGWGHGVGLCQIGAAAMAAAGRNYIEILQHYYPGTSVG
jgi:stage II sporulation protein D